MKNKFLFLVALCACQCGFAVLAMNDNQPVSVSAECCSEGLNSKYDRYGLTQLHWAILENDPRNFDELKEFGSRIYEAKKIGALDAPSIKPSQSGLEAQGYMQYLGMSPLILAVKKQHPTAVKFLLNAGADFNCTWKCPWTKTTITPIELANRLGNTTIICELLRRGAKFPSLVSFNLDEQAFKKNNCSCSICLNSVPVANFVILRCKHALCRSCASLAMPTSLSGCPFCRTPICPCGVEHPIAF